jgi:hypothetical protein
MIPPISGQSDCAWLSRYLDVHATAATLEVGLGHVSVQAVASETPGEPTQVDLTASEEPPAFDPDPVLAEASPSDTPIPSGLYDVPATGEPSQFEADYAAVAATPSESPSPSAAVDPLPAEDPPEVAPQPVVAAANAWDTPRAPIKVHRLPSGELLEFDERWYLIQNPGVAAAVRRGISSPDWPTILSSAETKAAARCLRRERRDRWTASIRRPGGTHRRGRNFWVRAGSAPCLSLLVRERRR